MKPIITLVLAVFSLLSAQAVFAAPGVLEETLFQRIEAREKILQVPAARKIVDRISKELGMGELMFVDVYKEDRNVATVLLTFFGPKDYPSDCVARIWMDIKLSMFLTYEADEDGKPAVLCYD